MQKTLVLILPLALVACNDAKATASGAPPAPAGAPAQSAPPEPETAKSLKGTVLEAIDAGAYTYVRVKGEQGEVWAAVNQAALKNGEQITIDNAMWMENFESKTLNRKFDRILFGTVNGGLAGGGVDPSAALPPGHPPTRGPAPASTQTSATTAAEAAGDVKVEKATGKDARTVAEIWAQRKELNGKEVVIRARVVKFNQEIMGRNWIHLRDGSGSADKADNDLTVTTTAVVAKGDIVSVRGKVAVDRDFTAGYAYPVLIEEAIVIK